MRVRCGGGGGFVLGPLVFNCLMMHNFCWKVSYVYVPNLIRLYLTDLYANCTSLLFSMYLSISPRKCSCWVKGPYTLQLRMHQFDFQVKLQGQPITTTIPQYELGWENSLHSAFKRPSPSLYLDISCLDRKHSSCNFYASQPGQGRPLARPC